MADGAFVFREIFEILVALAIRRCRLSGSLCRLTVSLKCFRESEIASVRISISDTGVGSSLEEFRALEFGGHPPFSLDKWDGVLSITTTSINEKVIQHYRLNLQEIVSSTRMRLKRLPCTSKHVGTFSGTEVCFSTEEENIDEFVAWVVKFVQKMHVLNDHETFVDLLVEIIDNHGSKHVQFLPGNRSSSATSRPMSNVECLYYGLIDYKLQQRGSVEVACSTRREDFKVGIGNACGLRNGRHTVDVAVLVVPLGSIACCLGARSQNTELLFFRDFSPFSITQSTLNSLGSFKWQNYGLKLKSIVEREGHAVLEWEDLPLAHLDIAIHTYDTNILQGRQEISDRKLVINKALKIALNDLKAKYTGLFLSSRALKIQKHAPALSRTIACLVTSSKDEEFQAECARLLGLEAASACNEMLELRIRDKLTETIAMNDLKHKKAKDMAPDLFQCEPVNAENCLEKYDDEDCGPSRHIPFRYFLDTNFTFTYLPPFFAICPLHPHCSIFHESSKMETLAAPEAPNLDSLPSERDEPVLLPVEEIRNPTGDNAEEESPFTVGDFVWAKAKGHPWWPAIISSPSESADRVMKTHRKTHSVPVAYFGDDDALAWCEPKQLKPFVEVFDEMSRQSRSMSFLAAVGCCMEEIGRCLEVGITCPCVSGEARGKLLLGEAGRKLPVTNYSPLEFLNCIREVARDVQVASPLDSVRLRSWVFAFGKGFSQGESWVFQQRRGIVELVDKIDLEEDEEASQAGNGFLECPDLSPSKPQRGGKRRSMSKLIAEMDLDTIEVDDDDEEEQQQILVPKKRKGKTDAVMAEEEAGSSSGRRERKKSKYLSPPYTNLREVGKFLSSLSKRLEGMSLRRVAGLSGSESAGFSAINKFSGEEDDDKIPLSQIESTPACEIFSEFISTAAYPLHLKRNPSAKVVRCFFAMYRSFIYSDSAKFEDYKNLVDEYITKNEDSEKDDLKPNSNKKNSKHGDHQASGLGLKRSKNGQETKPGFKQWNNCSEKQKPEGKRLSKDGISQAPVELDLPMVDDVKQSKEKQKLTRGKKPGDKASQEAPVELNLPSLEDLNDGKEIQKPSRAKKSGERTNHGAPLEVDLPLVEDINDGKVKQKRSRGKKSGGRTSQRAPIELDLPYVDNLNDGKEREKLNRGKKAPIELDLSLVDDLIENKEKPKPSGGRKSGWRTSQRVPVEHDIPLVGDLNEGNEKQKPSNGSKSGKNYSLGALLALECCRVDPSCEVKGKKRYGSKSDLGKNLADASNESKRKRKPGWKKKILYSTTSFQAPADLDLRMEYDSNEGELGKGRKRWKRGTNAEAEDQKMASGSDAGDSEEKESISKSAYHSNNEVGLDVEPVSCRKPFIMNEKMMEGTEDAIGNNLQNFGVRISKLEGAKSGRKKKNSEGPLKAKPGRRKDKLSGTCFEGQAALQLTFHSGVSLPSIEDLVTTYSKYGTLIDNRIELFKESNSALVVFAKSVDAESAFKDKAGPYGSVATYRLRYLPENIIPPQIPLVFSPSQLIPNITSAPQQLPDLNSAVQKPPLPYIRKSLETMISTLASSPSLINNISSSPDGLKPEARDNLVGEMQGLLLKVDKMLNGSGPGSSA